MHSWDAYRPLGDRIWGRVPGLFRGFTWSFLGGCTWSVLGGVPGLSWGGVPGLGGVSGLGGVVSSLNLLFCLYCSLLLIYLHSLCALDCNACLRSSLQAFNWSSDTTLCFFRIFFSFLLVLLVLFPFVYSVIIDISALSWSICLWSLCCHAGGLPLCVFLYCGLGSSILLVITRAAVYCFWLMVVKSILSCDVSSTTLSRMLIILFSLLSFFSFGSFCLASSG